jgi:uncharacterized protein
MTKFMHSSFHFAYNVNNLDEARTFYGGILDCAEGRSTDTWVDFNFFGHQISLHLGKPFETANTGQVDGVLVPMPHFGLVLSMTDWRKLAQRLEQQGVEFVLKPSLRFVGQSGEQGTMFFKDPSGNPIEIKGYADVATAFIQ